VTFSAKLRERVEALKRDTIALYYAIRDPRTPLAAKILAGCVVAYALSPIDLIPDFIPVIGYVDDLILVPLGIALCLKMIPPEVIADARIRADAQAVAPRSYIAATVVVAVWIALTALFGLWAYRAFAG
jgi:uncharacterized membrane protein YkvA (DUF1232 family)